MQIKVKYMSLKLLKYAKLCCKMSDLRQVFYSISDNTHSVCVGEYLELGGIR